MSRRPAPHSSRQRLQNQRQAPPQRVARAPVSKAEATRKGVTVDFLDETEMRKQEAFGCIMFASPGETMIEEFKNDVAIETDVPVVIVDKVVSAYQKREHPKRAVKYVGGYRSEEECRDRVKQIEDDEPMFHIWVVENGKWLTFDPSPELIEDQNYREEQLNDLMKSKKLNEQHTKDFYRTEMRKRVERARLEGTKEGQEILMQAEEPYQAVEHRVKSSDESIKEFEQKIAEIRVTKELAERKLERMRAEGKFTPSTDEQVKDKMDQLANSMVPDEGRINEVKDKLAQAAIIEAGRKRDVSTSDVARYASENNVDLFGSTPIIPSRDVPSSNSNNL